MKLRGNFVTPSLYPIEYTFSKIKSYTKSKDKENKNQLMQIMKEGAELVTKEDAAG